MLRVFMRIGCPTASCESGQKGLLRRAQKAAPATGCPIDFQQAAQFEFPPQRGAQQGKEAGETVRPLTEPCAEAQQHIGQERGPDLPLHGVGAVAEEVRQLEGLFDLLEEHLDFPAAAVKVGDGLRAPLQVVREKGHLPELAVHFDQRHHAAQLDGIVFAGRAGQADQVVAEDVPVAATLDTAHDPAAQVVLGAGDPKDAAHRQIGQMGEIQIRLVEDDNLAGPHARAEFAGTDAVVFTGGAHDGEAGQEGLQIQAEMTFGGGFAAAMFGPVETAGDQLDGGGVHEVNGALETEGKLGPAAAAETGVELLEMFEHPPEEVLGHLGWALTVGGGEAVFAGRAGPAQGRERTRVQPQGVADVVEAQGVGELGEDQAHHMAPRRETAGFFCDARIPGQLGDEVRRNQIAELAQEGEAAARWLAERLFFHPRPCGRVQTRRPTLFLPHQTIKAGRQLCKIFAMISWIGFISIRKQ